MKHNIFLWAILPRGDYFSHRSMVPPVDRAETALGNFAYTCELAARSYEVTEYPDWLRNFNNNYSHHATSFLPQVGPRVPYSDRS